MMKASQRFTLELLMLKPEIGHHRKLSKRSLSYIERYTVLFSSLLPLL
jgi:hypothetical protein